MNAPILNLATDPSDARRRSALLGLPLVIAAGIALFAYLTWVGYQDARARAESSVRNLSSLIATQVETTLENASSHLLELADAVTAVDQSRESDADVKIRALEASLTSRAFKQAGEFFVLDKDGQLRFPRAASSGSASSSVGEKAWFKELRTWPAGNLYVSNEVTALTSNQPVLIVARVITDAQGQFAGVVAMNWMTSDLDSLFSSIDIGQHGFISVRRNFDNSGVICRPNILNNDNGPPIVTPVFQRIVNGEHEGVVSYVSPVAGFERMNAFKTFENIPVHVVVGIAKSDYLAAWVNRTALTGMTGLAMLGALTWLVFRQRRSESELLRRTEALHQAEALAGLGHWELDISTNALSWSEQTYRIFSKPPSHRPTVEDWIEALHPDDKKWVLEAWQKALAGAEFNVEHRIVADGQVRYVRAQAAVQLDADGKAIRAWGTVLDITARKQAESAHQQQHLLMQQIINALPDHVFIKDPGGVYRMCNPAVERFLQVSEGELLGKTDADLFGQAAHDAHRDWDLRAMAQDAPLTYEEPVPMPCGRQVLFEKTKVPLRDADGRLIGVLGIAHDISNRRAAEQARAESEARFRSLADSTPVMIWMTGLSGGGTYFNKAWLEFTGRSLDEELSCNWRIDVHPDDLNSTIDEYRTALRSKSVFQIEFRKRRHDGAWRWVLDYGAPRLNQNGEIVGFMGSMIDITERKTAENALAQVSERLQLAVRAARLGTFEYEPRSGVVSGSEEFNRLFALDADRAVVREELLDNVFEEDRQHVRQLLEYLRSETGPIDAEFRTVDFNGKMRWLHAMAIAGVDGHEPSSALRIYGVVQDITARKQSEHELRDANRRLRALVACRQAMVRATDEQVMLRTVCSAIVATAGYKYAFVGYSDNNEAKSVRPVASSSSDNSYLTEIKLTWADSERGRGPTGTAIRTGKPAIARTAIDSDFTPWRQAALSRGFAANIGLPLITDGRVFGALSIYSGDQEAFREEEANLLIELARDLSFGIAAQRMRAARQQAELALRDNENFLRDVIESTSDGILVEDRNGKALAANRRFLSMWNVPPSVSQQPVGQELHVHVKAQLENAHAVPVRSGDTEVLEQWRDYHLLEVRDGRLIARNSSPLLRDGTVAGRVWSFRDVTERRKTELLYRSVIESSPDAFIAIDEMGRIVDWSPRATQLFGWTAMDVVGRSLATTILPPAYRELHEAGLRRFVESGQPRVIGKVMRLTAMRRDGGEFPVELQVSAVRVGKRWRFTSFVRDITARVLAEQQLAQSQRLEAIGQLTGGLAHDFNNMLGIIIGSLDLLLLEPGTDTKGVRELINSAQSAAHRGVEVTKSLLAVARRQALAPKLVDVDLALTEMKPLLVQTAGKRVQVNMDLCAAAKVSSLDAGGLNNALLNVVINARDAMAEGGTLTIASEIVEVSDTLTSADVSPGQYICVAVSDTGCGMAPEVAEKAFDPFFTTKDRGKGTGLGLAMVYGFARQSGGTATIESKPSNGTTVKLYLPVATGSAGELHQKRTEAPGTLQAKGERVLVVDDEFDLRQIIKENLAGAGYSVSTAADPAEALNAMQSEKFELLISDLVMPGEMDGAALASEVTARYPGTRILLMSGFADEVLNGRPPPWKMLEKPFRQNALREAVREVLDSTPDLAAGSTA